MINTCRRKHIFIIIAFFAILVFSSLGLIVFNHSNKGSRLIVLAANEDLSQYSEYFTLSEEPIEIMDKNVVAADYIKATTTWSDIDAEMVRLICKMLWTIADNNNSKFTIASQEDLESYSGSTHMEVSDYSNPRVGAYLDANSALQLRTYTYYDKIRPIDYYFQVSIAAGEYLVNVYTGEDGEIWGTYVTVLEDFEGYYRCPLTLTADFTVDEYITPFCQFEGIFDGNGHTITFEGQQTIVNTDDYYNKDAAGGLFCYTFSGADIRNTKFENISLYADAMSVKYLGGVIGQNDGIIQNCWVKNCRFESNRYKTNCYVGPIVGINNGVITNCLVSGTYAMGGRGNNFLSNPDGLHAYYLTGKDETGGQISNCINRSTVEPFHGAGNAGLEHVIVPSGGLTGSLYTEKRDNFSYLSSKSALGYDDSNTSWYYASGYNDGWPHLRLFMYWKLLYFYGDEGVSVDKSNIWIPGDAGEFSVDTSSKTITIFDQTITARETSNLHKFSHWTGSGSGAGNTFTAHSIKLTVTISFASANNVSVESTTITLGNDYEINDGASITISYSSYAKANCYKEVTFSFTDTGGTARSITYEISNTKYYIDNISNLGISSMGITTFTMSSNASNVSVTTHIKSYSATF